MEAINKDLGEIEKFASTPGGGTQLEAWPDDALELSGSSC